MSEFVSGTDVIFRETGEKLLITDIRVTPHGEVMVCCQADGILRAYHCDELDPIPEIR